MSKIPINRPLFYSSLPSGKTSFYKLRHIRFTSELQSTPRLLRKYSSIKLLRHAAITFYSKGPNTTFQRKPFRRFSHFLKNIFNNKHVQNIHLRGQTSFHFPLLKSLILEASRITGLSFILHPKNSHILPYLTQIKDLSLKLPFPFDQYFQDNIPIDSHMLLTLPNLKHLHLNILNQEDPSAFKFQPKNLIYLLTMFSSPNFKASVSITTPELIAKDRVVTVIPPELGATRVTSLNLGSIDDESFTLISHTSHAFKNLRDLSFTLKFNKKSALKYLKSLPKLSETDQLRALNISFSLAHSNLDSGLIFKSLQLPTNLQQLSLRFSPLAFCPFNELLGSYFMLFNANLSKLDSLQALSLHLVISKHMSTCYAWIQQFPCFQKLQSLSLRIEYQVEPHHTEDNCVKDILSWATQLSNLQNLELMLDFPNFFGLESLLTESHKKNWESLRSFVFKTPKEKTFIDDNFSSENLGYLLKLLEPSYDTMSYFELNVSSVNFNDECFGLLLYAASRMKNLRKFDCAIYEGEFTKPMFEAFEESLKSLDSLEEINVTTDVEMQEKQVPSMLKNEAVSRKLSSEGILDKVSQLFDWRH